MERPRVAEHRLVLEGIRKKKGLWLGRSSLHQARSIEMRGPGLAGSSGGRPGKFIDRLPVQGVVEVQVAHARGWANLPREDADGVVMSKRMTSSSLAVSSGLAFVSRLKEMHPNPGYMASVLADLLVEKGMMCNAFRLDFRLGDALGGKLRCEIVHGYWRDPCSDEETPAIAPLQNAMHVLLSHHV
ncbi:hypothetical protein B0H10DRAFT_1943425 [Mycena sp. CBHHK59/15]|nr:hypothetical protein B0H10DRAFT_1943425 [Mycena sp. CBHHK59/15]